MERSPIGERFSVLKNKQTTGFLVGATIGRPYIRYGYIAEINDFFDNLECSPNGERFCFDKNLHKVY